jgi:hypothetical protein
MKALKKEPIRMFAEPIESIISSHVADFPENIGLAIGKIISFTRDCTKLKADIPTINATEIAIILYSLRNPTNLLKILIMISFKN